MSVPTVNRLGRTYMPRLNRWLFAAASIPSFTLGLISPADSNDGAPGLDMIADFDGKGHVEGKQDVYPRPELDHTDPVSAGHTVPNLFPEDNPPRQDAGNLANGNLAVGAGHREGVALIFNRGARLRGHPKGPRAINHALDTPCDGRAVYVNIERRHEDADSLTGTA